MVDATLLVGRWDSLMQESWSVHLLHGRGASVVAQMFWATLRAAALRCELRAASCCAALLGVGGPEWHARER